MAPGDVDVGLLLKMLDLIGSFRARYPALLQTQDLLDLVPEVVERNGRQKAIFYLDRHLAFLQGEGYLHSAPNHPGSGVMVLRLTTKGEKFLQPELAEFGRHPMLPQVVKSLESQIQVLTYPQEEKDGLLYNLREAVAKQSPDVIAKVIAEVGIAIVKGSI
jgi:hypothetical protein